MLVAEAVGEFAVLLRVEGVVAGAYGFLVDFVGAVGLLDLLTSRQRAFEESL